MPDAIEAGGLGTVAILGLGLIGGSLGLALRASGAAREVVGWNRRPGVAARAVADGAIDRAEACAGEAVASADLVVIGTPVDVVVPLAKEIVGQLRQPTIVTDVGSTKRRIVEEAEEVLGGRFVGSHPMAGSEESGLAAASERLFRGATWVLTPTARTAPAAADAVRTMVRAVGAVPAECAAADHDRWIAALSHLPHIAAYGLARVARSAVGDGAQRLTGGSFRDGTRVAESDPSLWAGILTDNLEPVLAAIDAYTEWLGGLRARLAQGDGAGLQEELMEARISRRWFRHE